MASESPESNLDLDSVEVSLTPLERFAEFLQSKGKRITQQRRTLVEFVFSQHDHFDADELLEDLRKIAKSKGEDKVSRPTVYRTLTELVDAGLLRKFDLAGRAVYEHDYGYPQHDHLYCMECEKLIEFSSDELIKFRDKVGAASGFRVSSHRFIINGTCNDCTLAKRRKKRPVDLI